ncbi:MAG: hypothetical protein AB2A00_15285 [Myxococcota bacterium]
MASGRPDIAELEELVARGRHAEALEGYQKLLQARPNDPLLRARVEMLKDAAANAPERPRDNRETLAAYVVTQEEVADNYVRAGRYDDALLLLERLLAQRPQDRALAEKVERVQRLRAASSPSRMLSPRDQPTEIGEVTSPESELPSPPPSRAPPRPASRVGPGNGPATGARVVPVASPPPRTGAFGVPKSVPGGLPRPASSAVPPPRPPTRPVTSSTPPAPQRPGTDPVAAAAASLNNAREPSAPTTPVITDEVPAGGERTQLAPPPEPVRRNRTQAKVQESRGDATLVAPPPERPELGATEPGDDGTTDGALNMPVSEMTQRNPVIKTDPDQLRAASDDEGKTLLAPPPEGLAAALSDGHDDGSGFADGAGADSISGEPTLLGPPPTAASRSGRSKRRPPR